MKENKVVTSVPQGYRSSGRDDMLEFMPEIYKTVLEIGCGEGEFSKNLNQFVEYWGVEPDADAIALGRDKNSRANFLEGLFPNIEKELPDRYFDVIVCNDIIEHVENTDELFKYFRKKLKKDGCLVASIPNIRHISHLKEMLVFKDWEYKDSGILDRTHLRFFTQKSILTLLERNHFEIIRIKGINSIYGDKEKSISWIKSILKYSIPIFIFGQDIQYMQFGLQARIKEEC
ncbi:hypothetical protein VIN01S_36320 [Vibrio inusitatus NBRC 102082]|uniref:SAM-dependent methyltransferase n=1 Tax=Vibrio inusitatus NBRC 102082 TaxID=1219070 RepID=A0A4Y3I0U1_9VIBR|nr:class I SAM-dependent methyltransferase [Vibrio inusitatus]GEA52828.1 hypothetical protein VIN01S_36320 [Vibrio inusitatus NBRC 102082]